MLASNLSRFVFARANADIGPVFLITCSAGRIGLSGTAGLVIWRVGPICEVPKRSGRGATSSMAEADGEADLEA